MGEAEAWEKEVSRRLAAMLLKVREDEPKEVLAQLSPSDLDRRIIAQLPEGADVKVYWVEDSGLSEGLVFFTGFHEGTLSATKEAQWFPGPGLPLELWERYAVYRNDTLHSLTQDEAQEVVANGWDEDLPVEPTSAHLEALTGAGRAVQAAVRQYRETIRAARVEKGVLVLSASPTVRRSLEGEDLTRIGVDRVVTRSTGSAAEHFDRVDLLRQPAEGRGYLTWEQLSPDSIYVAPGTASSQQQEVYDRLRKDGVPISRALELAELLQH